MSHHNKKIDTLKLGCTLPNLGNICLHKSTTAKIYPITESDKGLFEKIHEDMVVFSRKAVVDETFVRDPTNWCKSIVEIDASQLYPFSMCQALPNGLYMRWELDSENLNYVKTRRGFWKHGHAYFQWVRSQCKMESFCTTGTQKKKWCKQCWWVLWTLQLCVWSDGC